MLNILLFFGSVGSWSQGRLPFRVKDGYGGFAVNTAELGTAAREPCLGTRVSTSSQTVRPARRLSFRSLSGKHTGFL